MVAPKHGLDQYVGQEYIVKQLRYLLTAAKKRRRHVPHLCFYSPPGLGKTHLANIIAAEMTAKVFEVKGGTVAKQGWERTFHGFGHRSYLTDGRLAPNGKQNGRMVDRSQLDFNLLIVDEAETIPRILWEAIHDVLQPADDGTQWFQETNKKTKIVENFWVPEFTMVLCTNYFGDLKKVGEAAIDRISPNVFPFEFYTKEELVRVLEVQQDKVEHIFTEEAAQEIAKRARGAPRRALGYLGRANDYAISLDKDAIDSKTVIEMMEIAGVNEDGLTPQDMRYLTRLAASPTGKSGKASLAQTLQVDARTLELEIEPWLLHCGLIAIVTGGRAVTQLGLQIINSESPSLDVRRVGTKGTA